MAKTKKMGRPKIIIDWDKVDRLCGIQCTGEEIAGVLDIDYDTLASAIKREFKKSFSEYYEQKRAFGKMSLRRAQYKNAVEKMNPTMQIWLGKQWLGQSEPKSVVEMNVENVSDKLSEIAENLEKATLE